MTNPVQETNRLGQSIWYDNIRRGMIKSGELQGLIDLGVTGLTANPTIFEKAIAGSTDYDDALLELARAGRSANECYEALAVGDIQTVADLLRPVYDRTGGTDGYASLEVSPHLAYDTAGTIAEARRFFVTLNRPNVMIKVPATPEGVPAIRQLISEGININITLIFSLDAYQQVREALISGLEELARQGGDVSKVASVASFFVSRVDTAVDTLLEGRIRQGNEDLQDFLGTAAIANSRMAYRAFQETFSSERFAALMAQGAKVQRPLWASTGTKNPAYSDVLYVEGLMGPNTVNTMPDVTLKAFLDHGRVAETVTRNVDDAQDMIQSLEQAGISMGQVTATLLADGVKAFADSFDKLIANIEEKKQRLLEQEHKHPGVSLGNYLQDVETTVADLQQREAVSRIWHKNHTVWKSSPIEITDRLGWLNITDLMDDQVGRLQAFAQEVKDAGYRHVVLLGMGGSSLGPEVLRQTFGSAPGYPQLIVLDSTAPAWVESVTSAIDPARTLFLVSSKSGSTIEPNTFYAHFRSLVEEMVGQDKAGQNFVAITDPGTSLEKLAQEAGFRRAFLNPSDIGGRYSVLSYFGLVPAALLGIDTAALIDRGDYMKEGCASCVPAHDNHGAWMGAIMGALAQKGRDKLTLATSPSISSFGLWVEQLLAESTGKEGTGIIPVAGEPLLGPETYSQDRLFVYLRMAGDDNAAIDAGMERIEASGQPVVRIDLKDRYDLGAEFFRWEFATAVAGSLLGIHPFDQPDVQSAKDKTDSVLEQYQSSGQLPGIEGAGSFQDLLAQARPGDYLATLAYVLETPEVDQALEALRRKVIEQHHIATTLGYGPRFLHSTGQLHKGGPDSGLFLQLTADHQHDIPIPGQPFTFGVLNDAQSLGDLQALQAAGRRVARVHLGSDAVAGIMKLVDQLA
jgi:transaldolase / glucose-6-phosphate isomerase